jgi:hypothetical protein
MTMKMKPMTIPVPLRATMPLGGYTSCLPPVRRRPPVVRVVEIESTPVAFDLDNLCDTDLLALEPAVAALQSHDWSYAFSDDVEAYRRGKQSETAMYAELAKLARTQAEALWQLYAPASMGAYRR